MTINGREPNRGHGEDADARAKLIAEIYEVALRPDLFGNFVELWERELAQAVSHLKSLDDNAATDVVDDPELEAHFRRAYMILEQMGRRLPRSRTAEAYVNGEAVPTLLFDRDGRHLASNPEANAIFGNVATVDHFDNQILPEDRRRLQMLLLRSDRSLERSEIHVFAISIPITGTNRHKTQMFLARPIQLNAGSETCLSVSALAVNWNVEIQTLLASSFGLTQGEISVVGDLAQGLTVREVAADRSRSEHTVRTQLKSILSKTHCHSQSDLLRVVATIANFTANDAIAVSMKDKLLTGMRHDIALPDGRTIPVNDIGPQDGTPVLFVHGMLDGFAFGRDIGKQLERSGIRLIAPTRPGFGDAKPTGNRKSVPQIFADDLPAVLDHFSVGSCTIVGHMAGSLYAYCASGRHPDRFDRVVCVSGGVPIVSLKQFSTMAPRQRVVAWTARFTPALLPTILRAGIAQIDSGGEDAFMQALYQQGSPDAESVKSSQTRAAVIDGYRFAVAQGHRAFELDSYNVTRDWSEYVEAVSQPVIHIHGAHDPVVGIDSVRAFANRTKNVSLVELPDAGQLLLFQQPRVLMDVLADPTHARSALV